MARDDQAIVQDGSHCLLVDFVAASTIWRSVLLQTANFEGSWKVVERSASEDRC